MKTKGSAPYRLVKIMVSEQSVLSAMSVMAAVIEESYCVVGSDELHELVLAHGRLSRAFFSRKEGDYLWRDGCVVSRHDPSFVIKRGSEDAPANPRLLSRKYPRSGKLLLSGRPS